jgi:hypothetical protein
VSGELVPATGVLPAALLHLTDDVLPAVARRPNGVLTPVPNGVPTPIPNGVPAPVPNGIPSGVSARVPNGIPTRVPNGVPPGIGPLNGNGTSPTTADPAATQVVSLAELERTRQQTAAISAQRDQVAADRDRLRREHAQLARRVDRLEHEASARRAPAPERTAVLAPVRREPTLALAPAQREPTRGYEPPPAPRPSTPDGPLRPSTSDRKQGAVAAAATAAVRRLTRMLRRLIALVVVIVVVFVVALVGGSAVAGTSPDRMLNRVVVILDQVRGGGS